MKIAVKYGLMASAATILLHLIVHFTLGIDSPVGKSILLLRFGVYILAVVLAILERKKEQNGFLTFGNGLGAGFMSILVAAVILFAYNYTYFKVINHDFIKKGYEQVEKGLEQQSIQGSQAEIASKIAKTMVSPGGLSGLMFAGTLFTGLVISLIVAAFLRKEEVFANSTATDNTGFDPYR